MCWDQKKHRKYWRETYSHTGKKHGHDETVKENIVYVFHEIGLVETDEHLSNKTSFHTLTVLKGL